MTLRRYNLAVEQVDKAAGFHSKGRSLAPIGEHLGVQGSTAWRALQQLNGTE
jgi:hypothetical protein